MKQSVLHSAPASKSQNDLLAVWEPGFFCRFFLLDKKGKKDIIV